MNKHKVLKPSLGEERGPGIEAGWLVMRAFFSSTVIPAAVSFMHQYVMFTGGKRVVRALAANAVYYLWPNPDRTYP